MPQLSHISADGRADMVDVGAKAATARSATASGAVIMARDTLNLILSGNAKKGDVIATARIAGIMAAKKTHELIPLCHPLMLEKISIDVSPDASLPGLRVTATASLNGKTGVEMEALTAVSVACLTIYDMAKAVDREHGDHGHPAGGKERRTLGLLGALRGMSLLPVDEAVMRLLAGVSRCSREKWSLLPMRLGASSRRTSTARLTQPPFPASAMDGYAVRAADAKAGARLSVIGMSRAGARYGGDLPPSTAVRIFTGAPVPEGADAILIQENARRDGDTIEVMEPVAAGRHIRPAGLDFKQGDRVLAANVRLSPHAISLAASIGHAALPVRRRPRVAILANGDELVPPGVTPGPDQIVSSNGVGLAALVRQAGGEPVDLGIAPDRREAIADFVVAGVGRRHPRDQRRCIGRRARSRAGCAEGRRHDARFLENRHAPGEAADGGQAWADARAWSSRQSRLYLRLRRAFPEAV